MGVQLPFKQLAFSVVCWAVPCVALNPEVSSDIMHNVARTERAATRSFFFFFFFFFLMMITSHLYGQNNTDVEKEMRMQHEAKEKYTNQTNLNDDNKTAM